MYTRREPGYRCRRNSFHQSINIHKSSRGRSGHGQGTRLQYRDGKSLPGFHGCGTGYSCGRCSSRNLRCFGVECGTDRLQVSHHHNRLGRLIVAIKPDYYNVIAIRDGIKGERGESFIGIIKIDICPEGIEVTAMLPNAGVGGGVGFPISRSMVTTVFGIA